MNSGKIAVYLDGVKATLSSGEIIDIKVKKLFRSQRSPGLRFSKFSFVSEVRAGDDLGYGYGESESQLVANQKCIVEGVERAVYKMMKARDPKILTSNGWAAHVDPVRVQKSAVEELYERDAILAHWLCEKSFLSVDLESAPEWLRDWGHNELALHPRFKRLCVFATTEGVVPAVMTLLLSSDGHGLMSQASAATLGEAVYKALAETCRIGEVEMAGEFKESSRNLARDIAASSFTPIDHAMVYAYHIPVPEWIFGPVVSYSELNKTWRNQYNEFSRRTRNAEFHQVISGPISVGYCSSNEVQKLFFGRTADADRIGLLNRRRLWNVRQTNRLCSLPHCVP